ncbi:MAG: UDP-glycosyltransferase [Aequorivita sp.]|nr:UDP-glycosyltransferase [Aequorivita sp.]|tara:strand:+ start:14339 stop:15583 length:1245 start_codon:yes stop_codon:yes gene_type:complete
MSKKILILAETIDVNGSSAGKARQAFIKSLKEQNFKLKIYHFSHKKIVIDNVHTILVKENKLDINYFLSRSQRVFQRLTKTNISKFLENLFGFSFTFKNDANSMAKALKVENTEDYDLIITLSKGASYRAHYTLLMLPQWQNKWLAYIHDPYPFHWYPSPYEWNEAGHLQKEKFFLEVANSAKWLGYPSKSLSQWMGQFHDVFIEKAVILPHQMPSSSLIKKTYLPNFFEKDKFTVLHAGNLLKQRNPFPLIEAWQIFLRNLPEAANNSQLLLVGSSSYHQPKLSTTCNAIPSIYISNGAMHYNQVRLMETKASANIILEAVSEISPFLPAKFPNLVQANRPIIHLGPKNSESRSLLGENYKYAANAGDVQGIVSLLNIMYTEWKNSPFKFNLNRSDLELYFSSLKMAHTINDL